MAFFSTNLHAMLASVSAHAKQSSLLEAAEKIDAVISFFNQEGFQHQSCVRDAGLKWEEIDKITQAQFSGHEQSGVTDQRTDAVRVQYLGRVVYAKPLMIQGKSCLFQLCDSTQRVPIPVEFVVYQDRGLFQVLISQLAGQDAATTESPNG